MDHATTGPIIYVSVRALVGTEGYSIQTLLLGVKFCLGPQFACRPAQNFTLAHAFGLHDETSGRTRVPTGIVLVDNPIFAIYNPRRSSLGSAIE